MPRQRTGSVVKRNGKLYARVTYREANGKRRDLWRIARNRTHAKKLCETLLRELEDNGPSSIEASRRTFSHLADHFEKCSLITAQYRDGQKIVGRRSVTSSRSHLAPLRHHFGRRLLRNITYGSIDAYRLERLNTPTVREAERAVASVHRELALFRNMLNVAQQEGWILRNPFANGEPIIKPALERKRERILSLDEEGRLLVACVGPRAHLQPIIIAALDTGMRLGELLTLLWRDVDFDSELITVQAFNTKTQRERSVPMTRRLAGELQRLFESSPKEPDGLVFGIKSNVKHAFQSARRIAALPGLRFHDLRHTAASRLVQGGLQLAEVARILGHATVTMTYRYVSADTTTYERAAEILDRYQENGEREDKASIKAGRSSRLN